MPKMRVTKYDPIHRRVDGTYAGDTWTSSCELGRTFDGVVLSCDAYLDTEGRYVEAVRRSLGLAKQNAVRVAGLEWYPPVRQDPRLPALDLQFVGPELREVSVEQALTFTRAALRELVWGKLLGDNEFYVHFGWDFYMFIGGTEPRLADLAVEGMFVEPFASPYARHDDA